MIGPLSIALLGTGAALAHPHIQQHHKRSVDTTSQPVIVDLFEWNYNSVGAECKNFIGPAGYKYVQVAPASEHVQGGQWWTSYQKVSNTIQSKHGSRDEFRSMVDACKSVGVGVLVDTIFNHMAGSDSGTGVAGTTFTHYQYNGLYSGNDFHYCGTDGNDINDWNNQWQVQNCELSNLADLKTESDYVRQTLVNHANDLLSLGVAGFRLDAAKHMPIEDLQNILSRLTSSPYITSEVIGMSNPAPSVYAGIGSVSISDYYQKLAQAFNGGNIASLNGFENGFGVSSNSASVYVASHDGERGSVGDTLTINSGNNAYQLAHVFMLAYPYGTPTILSSYKYSNSDDGPPNGGYGTCDGAGGANNFYCQHRWTAISSMVAFRAACGSAGLTNWQSPSSDRIAFGRDSTGFVAINYGNSEWTATLQTSLPAGTYCDAVAGGIAGGKCTGASFVVNGGAVDVKVPALGALAFYTGSKLA